MVVMARNMAADKQAWCWSSSSALTSDLQVGGGQGEGGEGRREGEAEWGDWPFYPPWDFKTLKPSPSDILLPTKLDLIIPEEPSITWEPNIVSLWEPFSFKPLQSQTSCQVSLTCFGLDCYCVRQHSKVTHHMLSSPQWIGKRRDAGGWCGWEE